MNSVDFVFGCMLWWCDQWAIYFLQRLSDCRAVSNAGWRV